MFAASIWSLILPSIDMASETYSGGLKVIPAVVGFGLGIVFVYLLDIIIPHQHISGESPKVLNQGCLGQLNYSSQSQFIIFLKE